MPNNTSNKLQFTSFDNGVTFNVIRDYLKSDKSDFDFEKLIPLEQEWTSSLANEKWGTKWNSYNLNVVQTDYNLTYFFETAWNYPMPIIEKIIADLRSLCYSISFQSACEGGWFALSLEVYQEEDQIKKQEWNSELGNDEGGKIRQAFHQALNI